MNDDEGLDMLARNGWLSDTPAEFRDALLSQSRWQRLDAGAQIQAGGEEEGEVIGLAQGIIDVTVVLGRADTPVMHFIHPVSWLGYLPILSGRPRRLAASARTPISLARIPQAAVAKLVAERPQWERHLTQLAIVYGDVAASIATDLLIRDSERRCAAVLVRFAGHRFAGPGGTEPVKVPVTQTELAGAANLSLSSVKSMLGRLAARGLIEHGYQGIVVGAPAALRAFVDEG